MTIANATVTLDGADITATLRDALTVRYSERQAAIATFTYIPSGAPKYPAEMVRKPVVISLGGATVFTGQVNTAEWIPEDRWYRIEASNFLQEQFEGKTDSEILALLPGSKYSTARFGDREDGWQYAMDAMSTIPSDVFVDSSGALQVIDWAAKTTPDYTLGPDCGVRDNGAFTLFLAAARDIHNQHVIDFQYRYSRHKTRTHDFGWSYLNSAVSDWCDWAQNYGFPMPTREIIQQAANGANWPISGQITYTTHPVTGTYCAGNVTWGTTDEAQAQVAIGAAWTGIRRWAQTVTENYTITLDALGSQAAYGVVTVHEDGAAREIETDDSAYENSGNTDIPSGWPTDSIGDLYQDNDSEADRLNDIDTLHAYGRTRLLEVHRQNRLTVDVDLLSALSLADTVEIDLPTVKARGKVAEFEHRYDGLHGRTVITIAISRGGGIDDPFSIPARPDTSPSHPAPPGSTAFQTHIGGCDDSPSYDPSWDGWTTNRKGATCPGAPGTGDQIYPYFMRYTGPDIETEARGEATGSSVSTFRVEIPQDYLVIT